MFAPSFFIPLAVLAPSLLIFLGRGPITSPNRSVLGAMESIGRLSVFFLSIFYLVAIKDLLDVIAAAVMGVLLILYYLCWIRYFRKGREEILLYQPLGFLPIPMALLTIGYLLLSAVILDSVLMLISTLLFAAGHIPLQWKAYRKAQLKKPA
ncbi:MAG TPA: hypothetical protein DD727_05255 [Clostridiales bacterium]|nr:hypothetical protein [Clostridiales bacterium]